MAPRLRHAGGAGRVDEHVRGGPPHPAERGARARGAARRRPWWGGTPAWPRPSSSPSRPTSCWPCCSGSAMLVNGQPAAGSLPAGVAVAGVGLVFVGVAAVTSQLSSTTRGASGIAGAVLGLVVRAQRRSATCSAPSDAGRAPRVPAPGRSWLSPIGWGQQMRPFGGDRWWAARPDRRPRRGPARGRRSCSSTGVTSAGACGPNAAGTPRAAAGLLSSAGLVWRLQRGTFLGWAGGLLGFGLVFGALSEQIRDVDGQALEWYTRWAAPTGSSTPTRPRSSQMAGMAVAIYVVQVLLRLRATRPTARWSRCWPPASPGCAGCAATS